MNEALAGKDSTAMVLGGDAPAGFEGQTSEDYTVPFLMVLQDGSAFVKELKIGEPGDLANSVTEEIYDGEKGIIFVPSFTQHVYVEWQPDFGGFVGLHALNSEAVIHSRANQEFGEYTTENGNELVETFYVFGVMIDPETEGIEQVVVPFTSTKIKKYKAWMSKARRIMIKGEDGSKRPAALFEHRYHITTIEQTNKNKKSFNVTVSLDGDNAVEARLNSNDELFQAAHDCYLSVKGGKVTADYDSVDEAGGSGGAGSGGNTEEGF